jgi:Cytochrome c peroxidase
MQKLASIALAIGCTGLLFSCHDLPEAFDPPPPTPLHIHVPEGFPPFFAPEDNPTTVEGVALGRKLFYDPILSGDNTIACADCHRQENAFTDPRAFSIGIDGIAGPRNSMSLVNIAWQPRLFWDGRVLGLEKQALRPIQDPIEMHENLDVAVAELKADRQYREMFLRAFGTEQIDSALIAKALAQFQRTLNSFDSRYDRWAAGKDTLGQAALNGMEIFLENTRGGCAQCHSFGAMFSDFIFRNNGLDADPKDIGRYSVTQWLPEYGAFKTPSMRNVEYTAPYMHDGRFATLEEVMEFYNNGFVVGPYTDPAMTGMKRGRLSQEDIADLIAFLKTLSEPAFLTNPAFSKP